MADQQSLKQRESIETSKTSAGSSIDLLHAKVESLKNNPNISYLNEMSALDMEKPYKEQEEGFYYLQRQLIDLIAANPDIDIEKMDIRQFVSQIKEVKNNDQSVAVQKLKEILRNPSSPLAMDLVSMWPMVKKEAAGISGGWDFLYKKPLELGKSYVKRIQEKPLETVVYTVAGAAGIYLGVKVIKWLAGKAWDKTTSLISPGTILSALALSAFGAYQGKGAISNWLYESFGLKFGEDKMRDITSSIKDGKIPPELEGVKILGSDLKNAPEEIRAALEKIKAETEGGEKGLKDQAIDAIKSIEDNEILKLLGIGKEDSEKKEEYVGFKEFILKQNPDLTVTPELFSYIADKDYEDFLDQAPSFLDRISESMNIFDDIKDKKIDEERLHNFLETHKAQNLVDFFTEMLQNEGEFDEFKGKTIAEVMHLIQNNPDKYLNKEAVAKANEKNKHFENFQTEMAKLKKNPELIKNRDFQAKLIAEATQGGVTIVLDNTEKMAYWVADNGKAGLMIEAQLAWKALDIIANQMMESENNWVWATGAYLHVGKWTACIGAPIGAVMGVGKTFMQTRSWSLALLKGGVFGSLKGLWHGLMFPLDIAKSGVGMGYQWAIGGEKGAGFFKGLTPAAQLRANMDARLFLWEDLGFGFTGRKIGMETLPEKIISGKVKINKRMIERLANFQSIYHNQMEEYNNLAKKYPGKKAIYDRYTKMYKEADRQAQKILESLKWKSGKFDEAGWFDEMKGLLGKTKLDDAFISDFAKNNKRLGLLLLDEKYALRQFLLTPGNEEKAGKLIQALSKNNRLLEKFVKFPEMVNDEEILKALDKLSFKDMSPFEKVFNGRYFALKKASQGKIRGVISSVAGKGGEAVKAVAGKGAEKAKTAGGRLLDRFKGLGRSPQMEEIPINQLDDAMKDAQKTLKIVQDKIKSLRVDEGLAKHAGKGPGKLKFNTEKAVKQAQEAIDSAKKAESEIQRHIQKLEEIKKLQSDLKAAKGTPKAGDILNELISAKGEVANSLDTANESLSAVKGVSKLATGLKWLGRAGAGAGTVFSGIQAFSNWKEAATTTVEGRAGLCAANAAMWTVDTGVGAAGLAVTISAEAAGSAAISGVSRAWLPLIPITYAGTAIFEKLYEETNTEAEWAQNFSYDQLVHEWFTSQNSVSLSDAWVTGFQSFASLDHDKEVDEDMAEKAKMAHKMFRSLVVMQKSREMQQIMANEESSDEKTKKLEKIIDENYSVYHEYFYRRSFAARIQNYGAAKDLIIRANVFDDIMQKREKAKKSGIKELMLGGINLLNARYDINGDIENLKPGSNFSPDAIIDAYNENNLKEIENIGDTELKKNLDSMETPYLVYLYIQMNNAMLDTGNDSEFENDPALAPAIAAHMKMISEYLKSRKVDINNAARAQGLHEPKINLEAIKKHLENLTEKGGSSSYEQYENNKFDKNPAVFAVYRLAQYFGFGGNPNEKELKEFFNEDTASYHGIYWDGDEWYVQERGLEFDDSVGPKLTSDSVKEMIKIIKENPDDVIEHRHDKYFIVDAYEFDSQAGHMSRALEKGLQEGEKKYASQKEPAAVAA